MMGKPVAIDLFCGAGGLSEGLRQARYNVIGAVEVDALACSAFRMNHRRVELWEGDISVLTVAEMRRKLGLAVGDLDLLAACPPCQGFSVMRTKNGVRRNQDVRNDLVLEVLRFIRGLRPKAVMLENVPGLAADSRFAALCADLESLGYRVKSDILNAIDFRVPQRRRRLVLLASRLVDPQFAPKSSERRTVREFIGHLAPPESSDDPLHNYEISRSSRIEQLIKNIPKDGGSRASLGTEAQLPCHKRINGFWDVYGRMAWDKPAPTITGGCINPSKGRFLHPEADRSITLREAALLQTFPKDYKFPMDRGRYPAALLIGNALPPEFIRRHAEAMRKQE